MKLQKDFEEEVLTGLSMKREISVSLQRRAKIIDLYYHKDKRKSSIKREISITMTSVLRWLSRWSSKEEIRNEWYTWYVEGEIKETEYSDLLLSLLRDSPRTGKPKKFKEGQVEKIVGLATTDPISLGLPFSRWSEALLKLELEKRGIVESISTAQIGRFLKKSQNQTTQE